MQATHDSLLDRITINADVRFGGANVVILHPCDYSTDVAAEVLRRNAIRLAELPNSKDRLIILDQ